MINNIISLLVGFLGVAIVLGLLSPFFIFGDVNKSVMGKIQEKNSLILALKGE
jgi:hypothetical protein